MSKINIGDTVQRIGVNFKDAIVGRQYIVIDIDSASSGIKLAWLDGTPLNNTYDIFSFARVEPAIKQPVPARTISKDEIIRLMAMAIQVYISEVDESLTAPTDVAQQVFREYMAS